jgi:hypothetical protein
MSRENLAFLSVSSAPLSLLKRYRELHGPEKSGDASPHLGIPAGMENVASHLVVA